MFKVLVISDHYCEEAGYMLEAGDVFQAKDGGKPGYYLICVDGDWVNFNASVVK